MDVDLPDEEVGGVFVEGLGGGCALGHWREGHCRVVWLAAGVRGEIAPRSVPGAGTVDGFFLVGFGLRADEREDGSGDDGDVGAVDELEHAEGVLDFLWLPGVAADHRDAEDFDLGGLQQDHHGHLVGAAGAGAVLVDEDEALGVGLCDESESEGEQQAHGRGPGVRLG